MQDKIDKRKFNGAKKGTKKTNLKYGEPLENVTMQFPKSKKSEVRTRVRKEILVDYLRKKDIDNELQESDVQK
jgi:putative IMPACT (imprinted ancient) family translation regulator